MSCYEAWWLFGPHRGHANRARCAASRRACVSATPAAGLRSWPTAMPWRTHGWQGSWNPCGCSPYVAHSRSAKIRRNGPCSNTWRTTHQRESRLLLARRVATRSRGHGFVTRISTSVRPSRLASADGACDGHSPLMRARGWRRGRSCSRRACCAVWRSAYQCLWHEIGRAAWTQRGRPAVWLCRFMHRLALQPQLRGVFSSKNGPMTRSDVLLSLTCVPCPWPAVHSPTLRAISASLET
jgi:hypothetical protein